MFYMRIVDKHLSSVITFKLNCISFTKKKRSFLVEINNPQIRIMKETSINIKKKNSKK